ncbi:MAG: phenol hydroxylase [Cyclobacteriaceae bacterium]|nr:MAG: phenol hydroxylase [Cyclobacteriaceae bacterium]
MGTLNYSVRILEKEPLTHDVIRFVLERPEHFEFSAGQAIELTINQKAFITDAAPFTLTGLNSDNNLEIIFKVYPSHNGMTLGMSKLNKGDQLFIGDAWDSFKYRSAGIFMAGGTGITPFIAILRQLNAVNKLGGNKLLFANKTAKDIFLREELTTLLGSNFINILSREDKDHNSYGRIDQRFLKDCIYDINQSFYLCGPGSFSMDIRSHLINLGVDESSIISEY